VPHTTAASGILTSSRAASQQAPPAHRQTVSTHTTRPQRSVACDVPRVSRKAVAGPGRLGRVCRGPARRWCMAMRGGEVGESEVDAPVSRHDARGRQPEARAQRMGTLQLSTQFIDAAQRGAGWAHLNTWIVRIAARPKTHAFLGAHAAHASLLNRAPGAPHMRRTRAATSRTPAPSGHTRGTSRMQRARAPSDPRTRTHAETV